MTEPNVREPQIVPAARFHDAPRAAMRRVPWWSRLGYIQRRLPKAIAQGMDLLDLRPGSRVLDFGCADQPYRSLLPDGVQYVGADLPGNPVADVQISPDGRLPLPDASFDAVVSTQVLEHVADPAIYLAECVRLLKPGGRLLLTTHGIMVYHPDPVDYWRWTGAGLQRAVAQAGLSVTHFSGVMGLAATGLQLFQDGFLMRVPGRLRNLFTRVMQLMIAWADRRDSDESRAANALVFMVVAQRADGPLA